MIWRMSYGIAFTSRVLSKENDPVSKSETKEELHAEAGFAEV